MRDAPPWRSSAATCPHCAEVTRLPAYRCPGTACGSVHTDLRSGRLGVWRRRCACGTGLPTCVLRAGRRLQAVCPHCDADLHPRAGLATDIRIAVAGGPGVGKTSLLRDSLSNLCTGTGAAPAQWQFADPPSAAWTR